MFYEAADAARVGKLFLDSIIFFSDFFASRSTPHPMIILFYFFSSSIHPFNILIPLDFRSFSWELFLCFFSFLFSFFFSFHSNENHLNIIVIFFFLLFPTKSFFLLLQLLQPPTTLPTFLFYFHFLLYIAIATAADTPQPQKATHSTLFTFSHTIHIIHKMDGFFLFFFFFSIFTMNDRRITADVFAVVVKEFMGSYLLFFHFSYLYVACMWYMNLYLYLSILLVTFSMCKWKRIVGVQIKKNVHV